MLALSPLSSVKDEMQQNQYQYQYQYQDQNQNQNQNQDQDRLEMCFENCGGGGEEFLLDNIDFDDFFVGINDEDALPDFEILGDFSVDINGGDDSQYSHTTTTASDTMEIRDENVTRLEDADKGNNTTSSELSSDSMNNNLAQGDQQDDKRDDDDYSNLGSNRATKKGEDKRKSSAQSSRHAHMKRKVKVDWTPELHKRFVQAVEQLGVDKAVPSRILELMGIDCLTRHNIASHLQKYRSHRKNIVAREVEATNWTQKRQLYCAPPGGKRVITPWHAHTIGFPPPTSVPTPVPAPTPTPVLQMHPHFRPLHVWGHPSINQSSMLPHHAWLKHLGPPARPLLQPPATWAPNLFSHPPPPTLSPSDPSSWHSQQLSVSSFLSPGTPYFPPHLASARISSPGIGVPATAPPIPKPPLDFQPSKESIDAAIGDVISKPWLPLPLGLKPPCVDGVLVELQLQGIPKIPPA